MQIASYKGKGKLFNRVVRTLDRGPYSHTELVFSDGISASSSFMDGGVRYKRIDFNPDHWDFLRLPEGMFDEQLARHWFDEHVDCRYDIAGVCRFSISPLKQSESKRFCSESVLEALGIGEAWRYTPNSIIPFMKAMIEQYERLDEKRWASFIESAEAIK